MGGQHLAVGVHIHPRALRLHQQLVQVLRAAGAAGGAGSGVWARHARCATGVPPCARPAPRPAPHHHSQPAHPRLTSMSWPDTRMALPFLGSRRTGEGSGWPKRDTWPPSSRAMASRLISPTLRIMPSTCGVWGWVGDGEGGSQGWEERERRCPRLEREGSAPTAHATRRAGAPCRRRRRRGCRGRRRPRR